jgi:hypothetical protein
MRTPKLYIAALLTFSVAGCDAIGAIFKLGMWAGVLMVLALVAVIGFAVSRFR